MKQEQKLEFLTGSSNQQLESERVDIKLYEGQVLVHPSKQDRGSIMGR